ncbi:MAG: ferritin [Acetobacteraceae bacterium]|nr:ferritin [Acetobacteraceae bacterium]
MAGEVLHEERAQLTPEILDRHRALSVMIEELEAIDWYDQRIQASDDQALKSILLNNREEEKEHFAMLLEWLRRNDAGFERQLATYLNMEGPIRDVENSGRVASSAAPADAGAGSDGSLAIGSLRADRGGAGR